MKIRNKTLVNGTSNAPSRLQRKFSRAIVVSLSLVILAASIGLFILRSVQYPGEQQEVASKLKASPAPPGAGGRSAASAAPATSGAQPAKENVRSADPQHRLDKRAQKSVAGITTREKLFISRIRELAKSARLSQLEREDKAATPPPSDQSSATQHGAGEGVFRALPLQRAPLEKTPVFSILGKAEQSTKQGSPESALRSSANSVDVHQGQSERSSTEQAELTVSAVVERVEAENLPQRRLPTETRRLASEQGGRSEITSTTDNDSRTTIADGKTTTAQAGGSTSAPAATNDASSVAGQQEIPVRAAPPIFKAGDLRPNESRLVRARPFNGDVRDLPQTPPRKRERPERAKPTPNPRIFEPSAGISKEPPTPPDSTLPTVPSAPAPPPIASFDGLDLNNFGFGWPPDPNGDVGPTYYIQTINTSIGIYRKSDGVRVAGFSFDTFMSQGNFGNLCDTDNFGDPVVLYDTFEDRWIITDFAFQLSGNDVVNPPGAFECFAVSQTSDPLAGGWNFYSINTTGGLGDYPKLGVWPDGLYMMVNMFDYAGSGSFQNVRAYAFNKAQMYAGDPTVQVVSFDVPGDDFTILPSNARLQTGTPPAGTPNYFVSTWQFLDALTVYKFHVDWERISTSTFTGPDIPLAASSWPNAAVPNAPSQGGSSLDVLQIRAMMQNQYSNIGGVESLWTSHTVRRQDTNGFAAPRWYQVNVTGGTVAADIPQAATWDPDGANVIYRFMPSVAVNRMGDMALGYSTSSSTTKPAIKYAGRLAGDPVNTLSLTEQLLIQGAGTQTNTLRWGDYSAMTLDPDGCTFWYTNEYYAVNGSNYLTRIGSFAYPSCTPVGSGGTVSGTVTATTGGAPISGATVAFGSRTTTTNGSGFYSFSSIPAGTYPSIGASFPGFNTGTSTPVVVSDAMTTTKNFSLTTAPTAACLTDTIQSDFQTGVPTSVDLNTSPDNIILLFDGNIDQQNTTLGGFGVGITTTTWGGQTFTPSVSGVLTRADINLFCSGCTGTTPNLTLSVRATSGGLPTGADLSSATIPGFSNGGAASFFNVTFGSPVMLTAGTQYALAIRPTANPSAGIYALTRSGTMSQGDDVYAGGARVSGATSGTVWSIPSTGPSTTDAGFKTYMLADATSGDLTSGVKDANPAVSFTPNWTTLSWNAIVPANTNLNFQVAASNNAAGPFNFVGPDGTDATFFTTSGASLAQFNGNRYLKYKAYLSTTDRPVTPTLQDVTVCFSNSGPTAAKLSSFTATPTDDGQVLIRWRTGSEVDNLGFNVYRELDGIRTRITPQLVAGSALLAGAEVTLRSGNTYAWSDAPPAGKAVRYLLEDIDLNGKSTWNGPIDLSRGHQAPTLRQSMLLSGLGFREGQLELGQGSIPAGVAAKLAPGDASTPFDLAGGAAVKLSVNREGWYRVSQPDLIAAGLDPKVDPHLLRLFVDGREVPISVHGEQDRRFDPSDAIEFYGVGLDAASSDARVYWLAAGAQTGQRIEKVRLKGSPGVSTSFAYTVERKDRTIYFSGLRNGDAENFFGPVIARESVDQSLFLQHIDPSSASDALVEVSLQGVTQQQHQVRVLLNGTDAGSVTFGAQSRGTAKLAVPKSKLREGENVVTFAAQAGEADISLIDSVRITYQHSYAADSDALRLTVNPGQQVTIDRFTSSDVQIFDVTNPDAVQELATVVKSQKGSYSATATAAGTGQRTLLALTGSRVRQVTSIKANQPSGWRQESNGADLLILTHRDFKGSLDNLKALRQSQGLSVGIVDVEDIYDEFTSGHKTSQAIHDFLAYAKTSWKKPPQYVLLVGDASLDPKNYLGFGDSDYVPTKLIDTQLLETASDDWLADFSGSGVAELAIGRLPVRTPQEAAAMVNKIVSYDTASRSESVLLVADRNDGFNFKSGNKLLQTLIPPGLKVEEIDRGSLDDATAKSQLLAAINRGQKIVNYSGHGSADNWRGQILTSDDALALTNNSLAMFITMTCLNGYYQEPALDGLAESLMKATHGGAVAVWASSGMTAPGNQLNLNQQMYRSVFEPNASLTIGEATLRAKAAVNDMDIRRTWILFGDPSMKLK